MVTVRDYMSPKYPAIPQRIDSIISDMFSRGMVFAQFNKVQRSDRLWELGICFFTTKHDNVVYVVVSDSLQEDQLIKHTSYAFESVQRHTFNPPVFKPIANSAPLPCDYALQTKFECGKYVMRNDVTFAYYGKKGVENITIPAGSEVTYTQKGLLFLKADVIYYKGTDYFTESIKGGGGARDILSHADKR